MADAKFQVLFQTKYGDTGIAENPKLTAYKNASYILNSLQKTPLVTKNDDGSYTLKSADNSLEPITFMTQALSDQLEHKRA